MNASGEDLGSAVYAQLAGAYWLDTAHAAEACRWCELLGQGDQPRRTGTGRTTARRRGRDGLRALVTMAERSRAVMLAVAAFTVIAAVLTVVLG